MHTIEVYWDPDGIKGGRVGCWRARLKDNHGIHSAGETNLSAIQDCVKTAISLGEDMNEYSLNLLVHAPIFFIENNGNFEVKSSKGMFLGMVIQIQDDPNLVVAGKWRLSLMTADGGLASFGPFDTERKAKAEVFGRVELI